MGYVYAKTYRDVKLKLRNASKSLSNETAPSDQELFEVIAQQWLDVIRSKIKESTENKYRNLLDSYILPSYGKQPL